MSDEKFEEFIKRESAAFNPPPATVPRDEMWQVVAQARSSARDRQRAGGAGVTLHDARRPLRRMAPWIGMAATLLIGVGIGRFALERTGATTDATSPTNLAAGPATPVDQTPVAPTASPTSPATDRAPSVELTPRAPARQPIVSNVANGAGFDASTPMQVASREHLVRAEALITVVAATAADAAIDSLTSRWARDMLSSTRLLLDSPAGEDPTRRQLLEDLETVLVLLVQRSGAPADERALLDRSLERTQLLTRLRSNAAGI